MFLSFSLSDIVTVPFGYLMKLLYEWTANYGVAMILFAILVKVILLPITAKGKKSMMAMSRLTPKIQSIQKRYPDDQQKQQQLINELYRKEGVSMTGGCLWSFVPLLILFPLYAVVRQPITYMLQTSAETAGKIVEIIKAGAEDAFTSNPYYHQMTAAHLIPQFAEQIKAAIANLDSNVLAGIDFNFLGIDLSAVPQFNIFAWSAYDWPHIGLFLVPVLSALSQVFSMWISQKLNNSVVTDKNGVQDEETAKQSQSAQSGKIMMWMMPLMSLWIGFSMPCAMSLYWFVQGIVTVAMDAALTVHYRKAYDAEDAVRVQMMLEEEAEEAEKERVRAERRAANPNGITENTSKKKLQQKQQKEAAANKAAAAKEYAARKAAENGVELEEAPEKETLSGIPDRPYARGRAYKKNRYGSTED